SRPHFFEIRDRAGRAVARSPSLETHELDLQASGNVSTAQAFVVLPNGQRGRAVSVVFQPRLEDEEDDPTARTESVERHDLTVTVARQTGDLDAALATLRWILLTVTLVAAVGSIALTGGVITREMKPLESLAQSIGRMGVAHLSQRIAIDDCPEEVLPVVQ